MSGAGERDARALVAAHPHGIPEGPAAIHFCPVPGCFDIWESEATCEHAALIPPEGVNATAERDAQAAWLAYRDTYTRARYLTARQAASQMRRREFIAGYLAATAKSDRTAT